MVATSYLGQTYLMKIVVSERTITVYTHLIMQHVEIPSIRWDYAVIDGPRKHSKQKGTARNLE